MKTSNPTTEAPATDLISRKQQERRRRIMEVARRLFAERGYDGVTMRDLANESLVSVPYVYKLLGGKDEVLATAIEFYFLELLEGAEREAGAEGLSKLISVTEMLDREALREPAYARALLRFAGGPSEGRGVQEVISRELTIEVVEGIKEMRRAAQLVDWVDPKVLGEQVSTHLMISLQQWAHGYLTHESLRPSLYFGMGSLLLGFVRGEVADRVEHLVRESQPKAGLWEPPSERERRKARGG